MEFEYKKITVDEEDLEEKLNSLGKKEWEFAALLHSYNVGDMTVSLKHRILLKKRKESPVESFGPR